MTTINDGIINNIIKAICDLLQFYEENMSV